MHAEGVGLRHVLSSLLVVSRVLLAVFFSIAGGGMIMAQSRGADVSTVGSGFLQVPGIAGGWTGPHHKDWIRIEARHWGTNGPHRSSYGSPSAVFSGPYAPRRGASTLTIAIDKRSSGLAPLMDLCTKAGRIPALTYAESSEEFRPGDDVGPRPADVPEYLEYTLKDVTLACRVVADAPHQALVLSFSDIEWLNYQGETRRATAMTPAVLKPLSASGATKIFVVKWFSYAHDVRDDQCPAVTFKPSEEQYYALKSTEEAAKEGAEWTKKANGVPGVPMTRMQLRGPHEVNVCRLPGTVPDPGHAEAQTTQARGFNLDGDDGTGEPPAGIRKHKNYVSEDGRTTGIDNQFYTVAGCVPGLQGHRGYWSKFVNDQIVNNGHVFPLVAISGIDDEQNDDSVDITVLYSNDAVAEDAAGNNVLPDYTFRLTTKPEHTNFFTRLHGRIDNGVILTRPVDTVSFSLADGPVLPFANAHMRLEILPDGSLKGLVGGYQDWRAIYNYHKNSHEAVLGFQCPGFYHALKRAADAFKDPVTGEYNWISVAYDIDAVPAFIPDADWQAVVAGLPSSARTTASAAQRQREK